jgi:hypothetical protein
MNCRLYYVFVPNEPLDDMVRRQAERRALAQLGNTLPDDAICVEEIEQLADVMAERYGLWGLPSPSANP